MSSTSHLHDHRAIQWLFHLNSVPTATFHEDGISQVIWDQTADIRSKPNFVAKHDSYGNLSLSYRPEKYTFEVVLVAHTDHPAFDVAEHDGRNLTLRVLGGVPYKFLENSPIRIGPDAVKATITSADKDTTSAQATLQQDASADLTGQLAVHDLPEASIEGDIFYAPVCDDFAGVAIGLTVLEQAFTNQPDVAVTMLLTRAEEIGFIGAQGSVLTNLVPRDAIVLSLEASSVMDTVKAGDGPVLREGDRGYIFDANILDVMQQSAGTLREKGQPVQSARMTGGVCEASLYVCNDFTSAGMAVPLLNYHNNGDGKVDREGIHLQDVVTEVDLLTDFIGRLLESDYITRGKLRHKIMERFLKQERELRATAKQALGPWGQEKG